MCKDGNGGAYIIWKDFTVGQYEHVYATHISVDNEILFLSLLIEKHLFVSFLTEVSDEQVKRSIINWGFPIRPTEFISGAIYNLLNNIPILSFVYIPF